ncbi:MAG: bifunctional folylpolyglutamate synthase/dihydrofolate synthase [Candidatus Omnitrophica bacterium]|nr:bifunctional folylpolyglutamate synthase/dihydrofolate synthase [Candidatus Omnitrophota bacterium]MDD5351684.1 bifunctional folylpolyglutamate synthase/dihydrofolate synthase [Candidatus Omnitrophota bacterium]MDD5550894.1 bifunctional folylpolyglutamate synthase/dihydrofolate synthase [Candidatus Omnitrophota bacterium]
MNYSQAIKYLNSFVNYEKISSYSYGYPLKLQRFINFLNLIGNPQNDLKVIHVAGTKGKGSTSAFTAFILKEAGFKIGLYTSPHLNDFRERIRILNPKSEIRNPKQIPNPKSQIQKLDDFEGMILKKDILGLVSGLKPKIDKFNKTSKYGELTFFEVYTAIAFQYFKDKKVDFAVLETGLGGRLDATNVCKSLVSILTPISLEHTYLLGNTLEKIAFEKASIIKKENKKSLNGKTLAVSAHQDKTALNVIKKMAQRNNAVLFYEGRDFKFKVKKNSFDYKGLNYNLENLNIKLLGKHQIANASLAICAIEALRYQGIDIKEDAIKNGLKNCLWPARFEVISKKPTIIIDGAQNGASVKALSKALKEKFPGRKIWAIFGIAKDKELKDTSCEVEKITRNIILTKADNTRAAEPKDLLKYFKTNSQILTKNSKEALKVAKAKANKNDVILVTGSLYLCGETREIL